MKRLSCISLALLALVIALVLWTGSSAPARAGTPPKRLDDNRSNGALAATVSAALSAIIGPIIGQPVIVSGRVLSHPAIHNLYWDDNWDAHNTGSAGTAPTVKQIDDFTKQLVASHYFDTASQYGVGSASFSGSHGSSVICPNRRPAPGSTTSFFTILFWASCEAGLFQSLVPCPPIGSPCLFQGLPAATGVPSPDDNSLYVVYVPPTVNISDLGHTTCSGFGAYHFTGFLPETKFFGPFPYPSTQSFAFAVVPTVCAGDMNTLTKLATHEIIEASTDPVFGLGWIDNSTFNVSNIGPFTMMSEASDICDLVVPANPNPVILSNGLAVDPYWSNKDNACVPFTPSASLSVGSPSITVGGTTFVSKATAITITASPPTGATGDTVVAHVRFSRFGTTQPGFTTCTSNPCVIHLNANDGADGAYEIDYFPEDTTSGVLGATISKNLTLSSTPPKSTLKIGLPRYPLTASQPYVTGATQFTVQTSATGAGVASISYRFFPSGTTPPAYTTISATSITFTISGADGAYEIDFFATDQLGNAETSNVQMVTLDKTAPQSTLNIGLPRYPLAASQPFVTSATPLTIQASDAGSGVASIFYRFFPSGATPPAYAIVSGTSATFMISGADGAYEIDFYSTDHLGNTESSHIQMVTLDNSAPIITIIQPAATSYVHSSTLTLNFSVSDGVGSGLNHFTVTLDGSTTVGGQALVNGLSINLLTELGLGSHTFSITAVDNLGNTDTQSVTFMIVVTPQSIIDDVHQFLASGDIEDAHVADLLLDKLEAAAREVNEGEREEASDIYCSFIERVQDLTGEDVSPKAAAILIADANYLLAQAPDKDAAPGKPCN